MSSSDEEVSLLDESSQPMVASDDEDAAPKDEADEEAEEDEEDEDDEEQEVTKDDDEDDDDKDQNTSRTSNVRSGAKRKAAPKAKASNVRAKPVAAAADEDDDDDDDDEEDAAPANDDEPDEDEPPSFAAALGLHRVGSKLPARPQSQQPVQVLNARGMPARIRKKNKLFFDDDTIVNERPQRTSPAKRSAAQQQQESQRSSGGRGGGDSKHTSQGLRTSTSTTGGAAKTVAPSPQKTPSKLLKKRKTVVSRYMKIKEQKRLEMEKEREAARAAAAERAAASAATTTSSNHNNNLTTSNKPIAFAALGAAISSAHHTDRKQIERIGLRLRNLLKLPKAHKWVSFEWFYSYIDRPLFDGPNDFQICLTESFPQLRSRQLTRAEWSHIRKLMGKPRRCSPAFFAEERAELDRRRHKIRVLQSSQRKMLGGDPEYVRNLPAEIPLALPIGTHVTARLRYPQDGIFTGTVDVVDSLTSTYRITFDRACLGTHSVPDFEIMANDYAEMLPLASLVGQDAGVLQRGKTTAGSGSGRKAAAAAAAAANSNRNDPLLGSEIFNNSKLKALVGGGAGGAAAAGSSSFAALQPTVGGFHLKLLELMIRTRKTLVAKEMKLLRLKNMNAEAEMCRSFDEPLPDDYQRRYASIVIGMEKLNRDMHEYLGQIQGFTGDLTKDSAVAATMVPSYMRERCKELAADTVQKNNTAIKDENMLRMITDLATIMWVASNMPAGGGASASSASGDQMTHANRVLEVCLDESRGRLVDASNVETFEKNVLVHMRHLEMDLRQGGAAQLGANRVP